MANDPEGNGMARVFKLITDWRAVVTGSGGTTIILNWFPTARNILVDEFQYGYTEAENFIYELIQIMNKLGM